MKRILAFALALCLLCGVTAYADNTTINQDSASKEASTTVSYTIATCKEYTVTIPASVTMSGTSDNIRGSITVQLNTTKFNDAGKTIKVVLSSAANGYENNKYALVSGENKIPYVLKQEGNEYKPGDTVLEWTYGEGTQVSKTLNAQAYPSSNLPAGTYSDTLTFTVSVDGTSTGIGDVSVKDWENGTIIGGEALETD